MLSEQVHATLELSEPASFARLSEHLPMAWIEQALAATGTASVRRRRLPAEQVVWLVIALALYRHQSIPDVLETLDLALPNDANACVSKSGIAQARERLGDKPLLWLFEQTARAWVAQDAAHYKWKGLALYAMDGTTFRTADSPENRLHFGAQSYASGKVASYPQVRGVSLTAVPTHLVADIAFGRYGCNEMLYAKPLIERIPDDSLTIFDKGFLAAEILWGLRMGGSERHFLIPAKKNLQWELLSGSADDGIVQMKVSPQARRKNPALPETWTARAIRDEESERVLLTSLTDRRRFKAADILACYRRRWEIETSYRELKQTMLGPAWPQASCRPICSACAPNFSWRSYKNDGGVFAPVWSKPCLNATPSGTSERTLTERHYPVTSHFSLSSPPGFKFYRGDIYSAAGGNCAGAPASRSTTRTCPIH